MSIRYHLEIHARRYTNEEGVPAHIGLARHSLQNFDTIELAIDGRDVVVIYIDKDDFPNFPIYDSNNDSKGDTSE